MRWARHVVLMGNSRGAYRFLVRKLENKRSLGKLRSRWENKIKINLQSFG
jgi:hypothetical protein